MPYSNLPKSKWGQMERCTADVKAKGKVKNPYAVCYSAIMTAGKLSKRKKNKK